MALTIDLLELVVFHRCNGPLGRDVDDGSGDNLALLSAQGDPSSEMHKHLQARLRAESRYRELQAQACISRALNSIQGPESKSNQFLPRNLVYYKRFKTPADTPAHALLDTPSMKVSRWFGPGRVLAAETRVDAETASRSPANVVWIITQGRLKKTHSSQLRHASDRERLIAEATTAPTLPWTFTSLGRTLQKGEYEDLNREPPRRGRPPGSLNKPKNRSRSRESKEKKERNKVTIPNGAEEVPAPEMADSDEELIPAESDGYSAGTPAEEPPEPELPAELNLWMLNVCWKILDTFLCGPLRMKN